MADTKQSHRSFAESLKYDQNGLLPAVIQDHKNHEVLMVGYMNRDAVVKTLEGPYACFYSRSRQEMWLKGETSGHTQTVKEIYFDCDRDTLLIMVEQAVAACHKGYRSCFFTKYENGSETVMGDKVFVPQKKS